MFSFLFLLTFLPTQYLVPSLKNKTTRTNPPQKTKNPENQNKQKAQTRQNK